MTISETQPPASSQDHQGEAYSAFIDSLNQEQEARKSSLEARGITVITTSGSLATLLFGLVALITRSEDFVLPTKAHGPLGLAVGAFTLAAVGGLLVNLPLFYKGADPAGLRGLLNHCWEEPEAAARLRVAATKVKFLDRAQSVNGVKAWVLILAMLAEVVGIGGVAQSVVEILKAS